MLRACAGPFFVVAAVVVVVLLLLVVVGGGAPLEICASLVALNKARRKLVDLGHRHSSHIYVFLEMLSNKKEMLSDYHHVVQKRKLMFL